MAYAIENALFRWEEGARRVRELPSGHEDAIASVVEELRRRLGSTFTLAELADLYAAGVDWAADIATMRGAGANASWVVDAAFWRYAREAADYAGGRLRA
jgi:hypothetical protein